MELLLVIAIIAVLAALLWPALNRARTKALNLQCVSNGKLMLLALHMYTGDHHELFPPNPDDGNTLPGMNWCPGYAGRGGREEFNSAILKDPARALLAPYTGRNVTLYKCPEDKRTGLALGGYSLQVNSITPSTRLQTVAAARTLAMNHAIGTDPYAPSRGLLPVHGVWLDGARTHRRDGPWQTYGKTTSVVAPAPSELWVFMDESDQNQGDAGFDVTMVGNAFIDLPGMLHDFGCTLSFADGHAEIHEWGDARTRTTLAGTKFKPTNADVVWLQQRTSAPR